MELPITDALANHPYFTQCLALAESRENKSVAGPDVLVEAGELMEAVDKDSNATAQQRRDAKALLKFVAPNKNWDEETVSKYFQTAILRYYDRRTTDQKSFEEAIIRFTQMVERQEHSASASSVASAMGAGARAAAAVRANETPEEAEKRKAKNKKKALQKKKKEKERKEAGLPPKVKEPKEDPKLYDDID